MSLSLGIVGCPKDPPPLTGPQSVAPASAPGPAPEPAPAAVGLSAAPEQVAADLAAAWCESGGEAFRGPIPAPDEEYPPALESCDEIEASVIAKDERDGTRVSVIRLEASVFEAREAILYQRGDEAHVGWISHTLEDESGEAGSYAQEYTSTQLRDVGGGPELEWVAVSHVEEGDSFEADRCYAQTVESEYLLVCGPTATRFACAEVAFARLRDSRPRPEEDLHDCDEDPEDLDDPSVSGFVAAYAFENGGVTFTPTENPRIDDVEEPDYVGPVPLEQLFEEAAIDVE